MPLSPDRDFSTEYLLRVKDFCKEFREAVFGEGQKTLVQKNRQHYNQLKLDIYRTRPDFRPFEDYTKYRKPEVVSSEGGPAEYLSLEPLDLNEVQKVIDESVASFSAESSTLTSLIRRSIGWELPGYVPFAATRKVILDITSQWKEPSHWCLESIFVESSEFIDGLVQHHFGQFKHLHAHIRL